MEQTPFDNSISQEPPYGASVVVYRRGQTRVDFLMLHRNFLDPEFADDWAWGSPSGGRHPGEPIDRCATRELFEETGLRLQVRRTDAGSSEWVVYLAEAPQDAWVELSSEHDEYRWLQLEEALIHATPEVVRAALGRAAQQIPA
jgi:8-oxo-dGTP pyrophosphatase MutT (NUDIX family)